MEVGALSTIVEEAPGEPDEAVTLIPATRPCNASIKFSRPDSAMSDPFTF